MNGIKFVFPTPECDSRAIDYISQICAKRSECNGCAGLENFL